MVLGRIADNLTTQVGSITSGIAETFGDPVVRLGVTGLARAGKSVFITSLVANLLDRGRMHGLQGAAKGNIRASWLQPQPDDTIPRFPFERHLAALTAEPPLWPESTRAISQLRLSFRVQASGLLSSVSGPRTVHLDIVDYPGEWLLDVGLLTRDFATWSNDALTQTRSRKQGEAFHNALNEIDPTAPHNEVTASNLAASYTSYLSAAREAGYYDCTPGRFLMPGELEGSPALTFCPMPDGQGPRGSLYREMSRRFEAYKARIAKPFFRDHFSKIDRQIVLVDLLDALHNGPAALNDLALGLDRTLAAFRPGRNSWLGRLMGQRSVERILFAATKADHLHHEQHQAMTDVLIGMLRQAKDRAEFAGAKTDALSIASVRATVEEKRTHNGQVLPMVRGTLMNGKPALMYPGRLPKEPGNLLNPAREGAETWLDGDYAVMRFRPPGTPLRAGEGPPHIRLDTAAEFLVGDKLR